LGEQSPLTVYLDVCVSSGISPTELTERGIAILALVLILSERRPVDLYVYSTAANHDAHIPLVRIETRPLDISAATYALASAGFLRNLCMGFGDTFDYRGGWAWGLDPTRREHQEKVRAAFGASEQDLIIYGGFSEDPHIRNPVKWLHEQLKLHMPIDN
jgi:hypothetical protein